MARIVIVGGGAREHALATALGGHELVVAPGNAGTAHIAKNVSVAASDVPKLVELAADEKADLVVVGPELPLALGIVDALEARGIVAFGPSRAAARLEGSKVFMKEICAKSGVPTAAFAVFRGEEEADAAKAYAQDAGRPLVVKADGLCAGKGVIVPETVDETVDAIHRMMVQGELGDAGRTVVLEELLAGEEASFHVVCDGTRAVALVAAQDHKRVSDGDKGPNTGGMGAYAPAPVVTAAMAQRIVDAIVTPVLRRMEADGAAFRGVLFVGLMIDRGEPRVLEFNVRFGDPEATVLVPMLDGDWFALLDSAARGARRGSYGTRAGAALSVVMAAEGYPRQPIAGDRIEGLDAELPEGAFVFHAGTKQHGGHVVTAGGRVLTVGAHAPTLRLARDRAYEAVAKITWRGEHHRSDIGHRALG